MQKSIFKTEINLTQWMKPNLEWGMLIVIKFLAKHTRTDNSAE